MREKISELIWSNLHTITIAHDDQPNESHRQVIFKEEIPQIADAILEVVEKELPAKETMFELQRGNDTEYSIKIIYPDGNFIQSVFMDITKLVSYIHNQAYAEMQAKLREK